ncbi:MAG TPA: RNB domain-containing ribonuclease, partial [Terrimesophilobacter sp.]|nr:RNB domain-containing ribonuclease [Terrimesophilobacter sp.]
ALAKLRESFKLSEDFPPEVEAEALAAIDRLRMPELDHTDIPFVTIDPLGATDLDQAMFLERDGDGYRVWYAIADVAAFVELGGLLDAEARQDIPASGMAEGNGRGRLRLLAHAMGADQPDP